MKIKDLIVCIIQALAVQAYFTTWSIMSASETVQSLEAYIKVAYTVLIIIGIILFERSYKKKKKTLIISGIELTILAIHTLLLWREIANQSGEEPINILATSYIWPVYYILKIAILYTIENRKKLMQLSDISEIVKEEKPTKKVAKKRKK